MWDIDEMKAKGSALLARAVLAAIIIGFIVAAAPNPVNAAQEWRLGGRLVPGPLPPDRALDLPALDIQKDIVYGTAAGLELKMDFAKPTLCAAQSVPLVVYLHPGGWRGGDKSGAVESSDHVMFYQLGFAVASIDYRLAPGSRFPAQIHDAKLAIRYLRQNAGRLGIDPDRIGVWGASAGAHLAFLLAATTEADGLEGPGLEGVSSRVQGAVGWFAPTDLNDYAQGAPTDILEMLTDLLGCPPPSCPALAAMASPTTYVRSGGPPILVAHGDLDEVVPYRQARIMAERLRAAGNGGALIEVLNAAHGFAPVPWYAEIEPGLDEIFRLLVAHLGRALEPALTGDLDMNGRLEASDLRALVSRLGTEGIGPNRAPAPVGWNPLADLNGDGRVDGLDAAAYVRLIFKPSFRF
jgi:acetyl esterase/lipase